MEIKQVRENIDQLPEHMRGGMLLYIEQGVFPGSFLEAVLCNDLKEAAMKADYISRHRLFDIVSWLYNYAPANCWGTETAVSEWCKYVRELKERLEKTEAT